MKTLSDTELLKILTFKVQAEKRLIAEIIDYVKEVDRRRLYFKLGYSSLFEFMTKELGYTAGSAQRRIDAARLLNELPEIKESLKSGEHNLMQISMLARASREKEVSTEDKRKILSAIQNKDLQASEKTVALMLDIPIKVKETKRIQKDESVRLEITLSKEQMDLYNQVKSQMSHINPNPTFAEVFEYLAKKSLKQPKARTAKVAVKNPRHIPAQVRRELMKEQPHCQWKTNNHICGSTHQLQIDHIRPIWAGGDSQKANLQVLCSAHNRYRYRRQAGLEGGSA